MEKEYIFLLAMIYAYISPFYGTAFPRIPYIHIRQNDFMLPFVRIKCEWKSKAKCSQVEDIEYSSCKPTVSLSHIGSSGFLNSNVVIRVVFGIPSSLLRGKKWDSWDRSDTILSFGFHGKHISVLTSLSANIGRSRIF